MDNQNRSRAWRRKQRCRLIAKRLRIEKDIWHVPARWRISNPGRYSKFNLSCNCEMCRCKSREIPTLKQLQEDMRFKSLFEDGQNE